MRSFPCVSPPTRPSRTTIDEAIDGSVSTSFSSNVSTAALEGAVIIRRVCYG